MSASAHLNQQSNRRFLSKGFYILFIAGCIFFGCVLFRFSYRVITMVHRSFVTERLECFTSVHEFGIVTQGTMPQWTFNLCNKGDTTVTIQRVVPGCGECISVLDYEKNAIPPGGQATVSVGLKTINLQGRTKKAVLVKYGTWTPETLVLYLDAVVVSSPEEN